MSRRRKNPQAPRAIQQVQERATALPTHAQAAHRPAELAARMSFRGYPPYPLDPEELAASIRSRPGVVYFLDSTQYIAPTDERIWDALIETQNLVIPPPIFQELEWWLKDPKDNLKIHKIVKASIESDGDGSIRWYRLNHPDLVSALIYYVNLLGQRKLASIAAEEILSRKTGGKPSPQEASNFLQQMGTSRAQLLARQGKTCKVPAHFYNDEELVVTAIVCAIANGFEVTLVTSDEAVFDQFYKAQWFLDMHYRAMLLAEQFADSPEQLTTRLVDNPHKEAFLDDQVTLIEKPTPLLRELLPPEYNPVVVNCLLIQNGLVSQWSWVTEKEVRRLLEVKAQTNGLSTALLDERNCHITMGSISSSRIGDWAAIGRDQTVLIPKTTQRLSIIDINLALMSDEQIVVVRQIEGPD